MVSASTLRTALTPPQRAFEILKQSPRSPQTHTHWPQPSAPASGPQTWSPCHRECVSPPASLRAAGASPSTAPTTPTQVPPWLESAKAEVQAQTACPLSERGGVRGGDSQARAQTRLSPREPREGTPSPRASPARSQSAPQGFAGEPAPALPLAPRSARAETRPLHGRAAGSPRASGAHRGPGLRLSVALGGHRAGSQGGSVALSLSLAFTFHLTPAPRCRSGTGYLERRRGMLRRRGSEVLGRRVAAPLPPSRTPAGPLPAATSVSRPQNGVGKPAGPPHGTAEEDTGRVSVYRGIGGCPSVFQCSLFLRIYNPGQRAPTLEFGVGALAERMSLEQKVK